MVMGNTDPPVTNVVRRRSGRSKDQERGFEKQTF
jgi:hypothetical protein